MLAVKQNQPQLHHQIATTIQTEDPIDQDYTLEKNRGRIEEREVFVYEATQVDQAVWKGVVQIVQVGRRVQHPDGRQTSQEAFYIDSTGQSAAALNRGIRGHWSIENTLHWTKDVVFKEDASTIHTAHAPENIALFKNWAMAIFRLNGYSSMVNAIRLVANDIDMMVDLLE